MNSYIFIEALQKTYGAGGIVMLPILVCGAVGFYFLYATWIRIGGFRLGRIGKGKGIVERELCLASDVAKNDPARFRDYMQVRMIKTVRYMQQGMPIVSVMAATAPLLGLLGTVTGMVSTFDVITLYGNQNPVLMADGISEALISTQSGLLIAFPLTLLKQRLEEKIERLIQQLELGATVIENQLLGK